MARSAQGGALRHTTASRAKNPVLGQWAAWKAARLLTWDVVVIVSGGRALVRSCYGRSLCFGLIRRRVTELSDINATERGAVNLE